MSNKEAYIDFIIDELKKGNVQYKDVCVVFCGNFRLTENTFIKYWKQANDKHSEQRQAIEAAKMEQSIKQEIKAVKDAEYYRRKILDKMEDILDQKPKRVDGQVIMPTYADTIRASERISKMTGLDTAQVIEQKNTFNESNVQRFKTFMLSKKDGWVDLETE